MDALEPAAKRPRLSTSAAYDNVPDIEEVRRKNELRLQGRFQAIFEKYGRDFDGLADEIDMRTMEVVVDNGHISGMQHERDITRRRLNERTTARRVVAENYETDELSGGSIKTNEQSAGNPAVVNASSLVGIFATMLANNGRSGTNPTAFANQLSSALDANGMSFDPYDPVSVAELGKAFAAYLAQLMQSTRPPTRERAGGRLAEQPPALTLTPPVSDKGSRSPDLRKKQGDPAARQPGRARSTSNDKEKDRSLKNDGYMSIWAHSASCTPEPEIESPIMEPEEIQAVTVPQKLAARRGPFQLWSRGDDELLFRLVKDKTFTWPTIGSQFPTRSLHAVQLHYKWLKQRGFEGDTSSCSRVATGTTRQTRSARQISEPDPMRKKSAPLSSLKQIPAMRDVSNGPSQSLHSSGTGSKLPADIRHIESPIAAAPHIVMTPAGKRSERPTLSHSQRRVSRRTTQEESLKDLPSVAVDANPLAAKPSSRVTNEQPSEGNVLRRPSRRSNVSTDPKDSALGESIPSISATVHVVDRSTSARKSYPLVNVVVPIRVASAQPKEPPQIGIMETGGPRKRPHSSKAYPARPRVEDLGSDDELG